MPDAIGKQLNLPERGAPATTAPSRRRRWWIAAILVAVLAVGALATYRYLSVCRNCSPILCDDPCTLPTFGQTNNLPVARG